MTRTPWQDDRLVSRWVRCTASSDGGKIVGFSRSRLARSADSYLCVVRRENATDERQCRTKEVRVTDVESNRAVTSIYSIVITAASLAREVVRHRRNVEVRLVGPTDPTLTRQFSSSAERRRALGTLAPLRTRAAVRYSGLNS